MLQISLKVKPGSFKDEISIDEEGMLLVKIREKPIDGAANEYLVKFLAKEFGISKSSVVLEKGATSRYKKINLHLSASEWQTILDKYRM